VAKWYAPLLSQLHGLGMTEPTGASTAWCLCAATRSTGSGARQDLSGVHVLSLEQASANWNWDDAVWSGDYDFASGEVPQRGSGKAALTH
jgi:hypothetical protein